MSSPLEIRIGSHRVEQARRYLGGFAIVRSDRAYTYIIANGEQRAMLAHVGIPFEIITRSKQPMTATKDQGGPPPPPPIIAKWAMDEARKRGGAPPAPYSDGTLDALALMIQRHEKEPIDPIVLRAREICQRHAIANQDPEYWEAGHYDQGPWMAAVIEALRDHHPILDEHSTQRLAAPTPCDHPSIKRMTFTAATGKVTWCTDCMTVIETAIHSHSVPTIPATELDVQISGHGKRRIGFGELVRLINGGARIERISYADQAQGQV